MVTYELKQPAASYSGIYEVLKSKQSWWHYVGSTWLIATDDTPQGLYDEIGYLFSGPCAFRISNLCRIGSRYSTLLSCCAREKVENHAGN